MITFGAFPTIHAFSLKGSIGPILLSISGIQVNTNLLLLPGSVTFYENLDFSGFAGARTHV